MSSSTVSRGFVQASAAKLRQMQERDLSAEDVVAIFLDGKMFADATMVVALGITITGDKRFLGFVETSTDCANLSWKLKRLQTLWFDGIGRNNIKPVRERSRDEESVNFRLKPNAARPQNRK